jgi:hypothetical protein
MTVDEVDAGITALSGVLTFAGKFYPPLALAAPAVVALLRLEAAALRIGVGNGSIVPDGRGGFVPASNSHYDAKTGNFI